MELRENLPLIHDRFNASFGENSRLAHFLHGVIFFGLFSLHPPNFSKASFSYAELVSERRFAHSYKSKRLRSQENQNGIFMTQIQKNVEIYIIHSFLK